MGKENNTPCLEDRREKWYSFCTPRKNLFFVLWVKNFFASVAKSGIRGRLKIYWTQVRAGSIPARGTILDHSRTRVLEVFLLDDGFGIRLDAREILGKGDKRN